MAITKEYSGDTTLDEVTGLSNYYAFVPPAGPYGVVVVDVPLLFNGYDKKTEVLRRIGGGITFLAHPHKVYAEGDLRRYNFVVVWPDASSERVRGLQARLGKELKRTKLVDGITVRSGVCRSTSHNLAQVVNELQR